MLSPKMLTRFDLVLPGVKSGALCRPDEFAPGVTLPKGDRLLKDDVSLNLYTHG
jgi:hypothetical protein